MLIERCHTLISYLWFRLHEYVKQTSFFTQFDPMVRLMNCLLYHLDILFFHLLICKLWAIKVCTFSKVSFWSKSYFNPIWLSFCSALVCLSFSSLDLRITCPFCVKLYLNIFYIILCIHDRKFR